MIFVLDLVFGDLVFLPFKFYKTNLLKNDKIWFRPARLGPILIMEPKGVLEAPPPVRPAAAPAAGGAKQGAPPGTGNQRFLGPTVVLTLGGGEKIEKIENKI